MKSPIEHPYIVKATASIPFGSAKQNHVVSQPTTDVACTVLPWLIRQSLPIDRAVIMPRGVEFFVFTQKSERLVDRALAGVKLLHRFEARTLQSASPLLRNNPSSD